MQTVLPALAASHSDRVCRTDASRQPYDRRQGLIASALLAAIFAVCYGWALLQKEAQYQTYAYDLGLFAQVGWNTLHGQPFVTTLLAFNYLADHFAPSLALVAPLFLIWPDARALLIVQAAAVGAAGIGIFLVTQQRSGDQRAAILIQLAYHLAPATAWVALDEFHPITLALPALTFATALLWRRRYALAAGCAALALLSTEDAVSWVIPFGLLLLVVARGRKRWWGALLAAGATGWIVVYLFTIVPALRPAALVQSDPHPDIGVFIYCGRTWSAVSGCLLQHPAVTLQQLLRPAGADALTTILGPTAGLGLLGPSFLVIAGRWVVQLLGVSPANYTQHYVALLVPAAYLAAGEALGWLRRFRLSPRLLAGLVAAASLIAFAVRSPLPGGGSYLPPTAQQATRDALIAQAVARIPSDPTVSVVATSSIFPHVALRPHAYLPWAAPTTPVEYVILDLRDAYPIADADLRVRAATWLANPDYQILVNSDDVVLLKRGYVPPAVPADDTFGQAIHFQGYNAAIEHASLNLQLFWRAERPIGSDYHFFVHLVDAEGTSYSQQDGTALPGSVSATAWPAGEPIRQTMLLAMPPPAQRSRYHLEIGWYDWRTGQRLALTDGSNHLSLPLPG